MTAQPGAHPPPITGATHRGPVLVTDAVQAFLAAPRVAASPNTRRAYTDALHRVADRLGPHRELADIGDDEIGAALTALWAAAAPSTWNRNRAAVSSWLSWCTHKARWNAPGLPGTCERAAQPRDETRAVDRATIETICTRRDIPLRERVLWRMLFETASRASAVLALNVEDCDLDNRRARVQVKGGHTEWIVWGRGTALLLPRYLRGRTRGPLFCSDRAPGPARRATTPTRDICPETGRVRLGYDRARVLIKTAHRAKPAHPAPLRRHPPRRERSRRHHHHGQRPLAIHPHRRPLHQTRPRRHHRRHRTTQPTPPARLRQSRRPDETFSSVGSRPPSPVFAPGESRCRAAKSRDTPAAMRTGTEIEYQADGRTMIGRLAVPDGEDQRPAVLIAHEGPGLDDHQRHRADQLAELGYIAFALDYQGGGVSMTDRDAMMARLDELWHDPERPRGLARGGLNVLLDQPRVDPTKLAAIGYCFGGHLVLELARAGTNLAVVVGFHPRLATPRPLDAVNITAKVLVCIGTEDPLISVGERLMFEELMFEEQMRAASVDWSMNL